MGLVIVWHSARLAEGVVELARQMARADVRVAAAEARKTARSARR